MLVFFCINLIFYTTIFSMEVSDTLQSIEQFFAINEPFFTLPEIYMFCNTAAYTMGLMDYIKNSLPHINELVQMHQNGTTLDGYFGKELHFDQTVHAPFSLTCKDPSQIISSKNPVHALIGWQVPSIYLAYEYYTRNPITNSKIVDVTYTNTMKKVGQKIVVPDFLKNIEHFKDSLNDAEKKFYHYIDFQNTLKNIQHFSSYSPYTTFPCTCKDQQHVLFRLTTLGDRSSCVQNKIILRLLNSYTKDISTDPNYLKSICLMQNFMALISSKKIETCVYNIRTLIIECLAKSYIDREKCDKLVHEINDLFTDLNENILTCILKQYQKYYNKLMALPSSKEYVFLKRRCPMIYGQIGVSCNIALPLPIVYIESLLSQNVMSSFLDDTSAQKPSKNKTPTHAKSLKTPQEKIKKTSKNVHCSKKKTNYNNTSIEKNIIQINKQEKANDDTPTDKITHTQSPDLHPFFAESNILQQKIFYYTEYMNKCLNCDDKYHNFPILLDILVMHYNVYKIDTLDNSATCFYWPIIIVKVDGTEPEPLLYVIIKNKKNIVFHRGPRKVAKTEIANLIYGNIVEKEKIYVKSVNDISKDFESSNPHTIVDHMPFLHDSSNIIEDKKEGIPITTFKDPCEGLLGCLIVQINDIYTKIYAPFLDRYIFVPRTITL